MVTVSGILCDVLRLALAEMENGEISDRECANSTSALLTVARRHHARLMGLLLGAP